MQTKQVKQKTSSKIPGGSRMKNSRFQETASGEDRPQECQVFLSQRSSPTVSTVGKQGHWPGDITG